LGSIASIFGLYRYYQSKSELQILEIGKGSLFSRQNVKGYKIIYGDKDQEIQNIKYYAMRILNSGGQPIRETDFESQSQIAFLLEGFDTITSFDITEKEPADLNIHIMFEKNSLKINPLLLNSDDFFSINVLGHSADDSQVNLKIEKFRIANIKRPKVVTFGERKESFLDKYDKILLFLTAIIGGILSAFAYDVRRWLVQK